MYGKAQQMLIQINKTSNQFNIFPYYLRIIKHLPRRGCSDKTLIEEFKIYKMIIIVDLNIKIV